MSSYEKVARIGAALGGIGGVGFVIWGVVAGATLTGAAPVVLFVGECSAVGAGVSALGKFIFDS